MILPYFQGRLKVISGPVLAGKTGKLVSLLDSLFDGGALNGKDTLLVKHPRDDRDNMRKVGNYPALETDDADEIFRRVDQKTDTVFIAGVSHFDENMIDLVDALVRSNRNVVATGINLHSNGKPYGIMPKIMALTDDTEVMLAQCDGAGCDGPAAMSYLKSGEGYHPVCYFHYMMLENPSLAYRPGGWIESDAGAMFSGKSNELDADRRTAVVRKIPHTVFKFSRDTKGSADKVEKHSGGTIDAVVLEGGKAILNYLNGRPEIRRIYIDEFQFWPEIYDTCLELAARGYRIRGTGLPRPFYRTGFGEMPAIMCLADKVNYHHAVCKFDGCRHPGTENQRIIPHEYGGPRVPDVKADPVFFPGDSYEARCLKHLEVLNEDENPYKLERFNRKYD